MLPVSPNSKLRAEAFLDLIKATKCIPPWMTGLFSRDGQNLKVAEKFIFPKDSRPPGWFGTWHSAALAVCQTNEWELTTGSLELMPKDISKMVADGISIGKPDPTGHWTDFPQFMGKDQGEGGITVPTQKIKDDLNAAKDAQQHYSGVIVKTGSARGAIVVVNRFKTDQGDLPMNANEITGILFHEMLHAGQISQGLPNSHKDPRFEKVIKAIDDQFKGCPTP
jgi:hypothetical protein